MSTPLPTGFRVALDPDTKRIDDVTLFGGSPARILRLTASGLTAWSQLCDGPVTSPAAGQLARRLTDSGLAHPRPPAPTVTPEVTVIIPVRDRTPMLARCLASLDGSYPVVVVDDGSSDRRAVADVAEEYHATLVSRARSGGPGAARDTGLATVDTELVAFLDSDCVATPGWIERLSSQFGDPLVAAVAPRVVALPSASPAGRYAATSGSLDLGEREGRVMAGSRVAYVPTAALVVRRGALRTVMRDGGAFDKDLRYGEDVDLVWRLNAAGWRVRYDPSVRVHHHEPRTWRDLLARRFRYGTSAAPLARRHPTALAPLVLHTWPTLAVVGLLARQPAAAALAFALSVSAMKRTLRRAELPTAGVVRPMLTGVRQTWLGLGRYGTQFALPVLVVALIAPGGGTFARRWGRRAAVASLLFGPASTTWSTQRPALDPVRFVLAKVADDAAYGAGVWAGCVRHRTTVPLRPAVSWRLFRTGDNGASSQSKGSH